MTSAQDVTRLLCDLIALPSVNPEQSRERTEAPYGEARMADYVQHFFQPFGLRIERQQALPGRDSVLVHVPGTSSAAPLLLEAHMDTVGGEGMDSPFTPRVEGGRIYGRGTSDTKSALAAEMMALKEVLEEGRSLCRGCVLAATADEEYGMLGARRLVESGMAFSGAIVGEPTALQVVSAHDGQMYCQITACGKAAHTSNPQNGVNAIYLMHEVIGVLRRRSDSLYPLRKHALCGSPLLTVSMIQGGMSEHIVPDRCEIRMDFRVIPGETCRQVFEEMKGWLAQDLDPASFGWLEFSSAYKMEPPAETPSDHPLVQAMVQASSRVLGGAQVAGVRYNTNASHYSSAGIPCVVFGPGHISQAHAAVEFVEIEPLGTAVKILKSLLLESFPS
jgi:acetylornithine deacetylase